LGLTLNPGAVLKIAVDDETMWMLPGELYAIEKGLEFQETKYDNCTYRGYYNKDGEEEGVGIAIFNHGEKHSGEYKRGKRNGVLKVEYANGNICWGQWKDDLREGYTTYQWKSNGQKYTG
jgi:1-phosphatidylinositol-4-phosphate 5-kinase